ncbi:acylphosphatase [Bombilactobacillus thymidiniphilus]|uniref:acylphosphatase n=1 Tax=Bombilactobacillus thymidiniphilus TaxID=2923363 RepID=A0ABY4PCZ4_9LACO|nr:acylphosphatase [Bombilactobacillus thymidiniphilus]UQS83376.1 acylphosphatase [Bombilactobacillus thymidiniphilus]
MQLIHVSIDVYGRVQGVGFRYTTFTYAQQFSIVGSVQNLSDGSVHIEAQGQHADLNEFISAIKHGPNRFARVDDVKIKSQPLADYSDFSIS